MSDRVGGDVGSGRHPFLAGRVEPADEMHVILTALPGHAPTSLAQWVNELGPTARWYESLWRQRSIGIITGGATDTRAELRRMLAWIEPKAGELVLDAGASAGLYARTLKEAQPAAEVHAVDLSLPFLRHAARTAAEADLDLVLLQADLVDLPYRSASFDAIASGGTLNELADADRGLAEFSRVLRPGGRLYLMFTTRANTRLGRLAQQLMEPSGLHFPSLAQVDAMALRHGLEPVEGEQHPPIALRLYGKRAATRPVEPSG